MSKLGQMPDITKISTNFCGLDRDKVGRMMPEIIIHNKTCFVSSLKCLSRGNFLNSMNLKYYINHKEKKVKGESKHKDSKTMKIYMSFKRHASNYFTLHRSDIAHL